MKNLIKKSILKKLIYIKLRKKTRQTQDSSALDLATMSDPHKIY
jgi:hypothetical protein